MIGELLRTLAYTAERESQVSVDYAILEDDVFKPMANNSVLQELGL